MTAIAVAAGATGVVLTLRHLGSSKPRQVSVGGPSAPGASVSPKPSSAPNSQDTKVSTAQADLPGFESCTQQTPSTPPGEAPSASFDDCLQVPKLAPGSYTVELLGTHIGEFPPSTIGPAPSGTTMTLTPASGPPGTRIMISGYYPGGPPTSVTPESIEVCWGGCTPNGLIVGMTIQWNDDGHFSGATRFPTDPWIGQGRVAPLRTEDVTVGLECFRQNPGPFCLGHTDVSATFHLIAEGPQPCEKVLDCATLSVSPTVVVPGEEIRVSGHMPIPTLVNDLGQFKLAWATETATPSLTADLKAPTQRGGEFNTFLLATSTLTVAANPLWSVLHNPRPVFVQPNGIGNLQSDPSSPKDLALCSGPSISTSRDGGATWQSVSVTGAAGLSTGAGCAGAWIDLDQPDSSWVAGTVSTSPDNTEAGFVGSYTTDRGRSWRAVPVPSGLAATDFGGFRVDGDNVAALFSDHQQSQPSLVVLETTDGGHAWHPGTLGCPSSGPCVTWGPAAPGNCAKFGDIQNVLTSSDAGVTWQPVENPAATGNTCAPAYLVSLSSGDLALLEGGVRSSFGPMVSSDGGATWAVVTVPTVAQPPDSGETEPEIPSTLLLPDGSLLGFGTGAGHQLLLPGDAAWCEETYAALESPPYDERYEVIGSRLWWIDASGARPVPRSVALRTLSC